ncbi:serine hydrolase domain-containing protein [Candidatus Xianfuyuplasma coldseepsis]|uniref:Beta-lactamase family protein n=1 Tax=Candidatus Xianfuyuplasma coldseepsis TaxID=2782163 RepID=A0A7L7KVG5_9MOLU|nr:serine hydrolase domain-containing protein [Xianfuyuplasma coldseepsis]QMS85748.1 beta-lactamase family protein [Xianfuyuplasma coldseepsis]
MARNRMDLHELETFVATMVASWKIPGLALGIGSIDKNLIEIYHGKLDDDPHHLVNHDSVFCVASIGKFVVALAVLQLHEQGVIDIDAPIVSYLPELHLPDKKEHEITVTMLLNHRSGLPDFTLKEYVELLHEPKMDWKTYVNLHPVTISSPGVQFKYSNLGYDILGMIIQEVTHMPFTTYMKTVLEQLSMHHSYFSKPTDKNHLAMPYVRIPALTISKTYPYNAFDAPSSFMHTTIRDMLNLYRNIDKIISKSTFQQMTTSHSNRSYPPFYEATGLGINIGHFEQEVVFSHGGMGFGFSGFYMMFPTRDISAVVLLNEESFAHHHLAHAMAHVITNTPLQQPRVSWIIKIADIFHQSGLQQAIQYARMMVADPQSTYEIDPYDLMNLIYQMIVAEEQTTAKAFLDLYLDLYPDDEEALDIKSVFNF